MTEYKMLGDMELLELLYTEEELLPCAVVDEFVRRGEAMIEPLAEIATNQHGWRSEGPEWWPGIHAVFILGAIGTRKTVRPLLQALRHATSYQCEFLIMDMPVVFGSIGVPAADGLMRIASDDTSDWLVRCIAMEGLAAITLKAQEQEARIFEYIRSILVNQTEDRDVRSGAGHVLLDFLRREAYDDLLVFGREEKKLKDENSDYTADFYDSDVEKTFVRNVKELEMYTRDWLEFYDDEAVAQRREMRNDILSEDGDDDEDFTDDPFPGQRPFLLESAKIGRNDPCSCGSGKKYKKCCLGKEK